MLTLLLTMLTSRRTVHRRVSSASRRISGQRACYSFYRTVPGAAPAEREQQSDSDE